MSSSTPSSSSATPAIPDFIASAVLAAPAINELRKSSLVNNRTTAAPTMAPFQNSPSSQLNSSLTMPKPVLSAISPKADASPERAAA